MTLHDFGVLSIIVAYAWLTNRLLGFQSWQPILRFANLPKYDTPESHGNIIRIGFILDFIAAWASGFLASTFAFIVAPRLGLDSNETSWMALFCLFNLAMVSGAPTAVLRLTNRHGMLTLQASATATLKLAASGLALFSGGDPTTFLMAWGIAGLAGNALLLAMGVWACRRHDIPLGGSLSPRAVLRAYPGLLTSFVETNLIQSAKMFRDGDILLVSAILSPAAAGLFRVAKQIGDLVVKACDPLAVVVFGEFARLNGRSNNLAVMRLMNALIALAVAGGCAAMATFFAIGRSILIAVFGEAYGEAFDLALLCLAGSIVRSVGLVISPALLSAGVTRPMLFLMLISGVFYYIALWLGGTLLDTEGIGWAVIGFAVVSTGAQMVMFWSRVRRAPASQHPPLPHKPIQES